MVFKRSMDNSISFKSKIKFVKNTEFFMNHNKGQFIGFRHDVPNILKSDRFYTEAIRTCTGGGLVNPQKGALGFHLWDDKTNKKNFEKISMTMVRWLPSAERGILVGSKKLLSSPYSIEQFSRLKEFLSNRIKKISMFECHVHDDSQTHFSYSLKDDTWLLSSTYIDKDTGEYVLVDTIEKLRKAFAKIKIADGDSLFIAGQNVTRLDAPDFF